MIVGKGQKGFLVLALVNVVNLAGFGVYYLAKLNYEFMIYMAVVLAAMVVVGLTMKRVNYSAGVLWGLTVWAVMHMAGGAVYLGEIRLYELILLPLSDSLPIFRYDQLVHIWGFGVTTVVCYELIAGKISGGSGGFGFWLVIAMAGLGIGAVNEIMEFFVTLIVPESGVGDYINTSLDMIADIIGAIIAVVCLSRRTALKEEEL